MRKAGFYLMITILLATSLIVAGCTGTTTSYSNTFVKPTQAVRDLKVLYLENKLVAKGGAALLGSSGSLAAIGYNDLPELLRERVPIVFGSNGISTEYATIQKADFGQREALDAIQWPKKGGADAPLLVIQVVDGSAMTYRGGTAYYLNMHANLYGPSAKTRRWTGQFQNILSKSLLVRKGFDNEFVDNMLKNVLEQMAKDGIVQMQGIKVTLRDRDEAMGESKNLSAAKSDASGLSLPTEAGRAISVEDVDAVPMLNERGKEGYREWLKKSPPRAFVIAEDYSWNATWGTKPKDTSDPVDPAERAMKHCRQRGLKKCKLYAIDHRVYWTSE